MPKIATNKITVGMIINGFKLLEPIKITKTGFCSYWLVKCTKCSIKYKRCIYKILKNKNFTGCKKCIKHKIHGGTGTRTFESWRSMWARIRRTCSKHTTIYDNIYVDPKWIEYINFHTDMGDRPNNISLDRIDNTKGYYKNNCRWASPAIQSRNKSNSIKLTFKGVTKTLYDWAEFKNVSKKTAGRRYQAYKKHGYDLTEEYLFGPKRKNQIKMKKFLNKL